MVSYSKRLGKSQKSINIIFKGIGKRSVTAAAIHHSSANFSFISTRVRMRGEADPVPWARSLDESA
jgi:hypothetical protein